MNAARLTLYALPVVATQFVYAPFSTVLPGIYTKYFGLSAATVAWVLLITRIFDAVSDPLIGHFSDRTRTQIGQRKPWFIAGVILTAVGIWNITHPDLEGDVSRQFLLWALMFYLGWTMVEIPHAAWGADLDRGYTGRNRIFFARTIGAIVGPLAFAAVPLLVAAPSTEMTPEVMQAVAWLFITFAPLCVLMTLVWLPHSDARSASEDTDGVLQALRAVSDNRLFWHLAGVFVTAGLAAGVNGTLMFIFVDTYLGIGERLALILGVMMVAALVGLPLWLTVLKYVDKPRAWGCSLALASLWVAAPALLSPGEAAYLPLAVMTAGLALCSGAGAMVPFALLGDVIDYDELRTGHNRSGAYFSVFTFGVKLNAAIGGSVAFALLALFDYDPAATHNSAAALAGLKVTYALLPAVLFAGAAILVFRFPLDRRKHRIVQRALMRRLSRTGPM